YKHPGALGQPWHQDAWYFRMEPPVQVGAWLAVTAATPDNGPLSVVPGSHLEDVHESVEWDEREDAGSFYVEIQGADTDAETVVLMEPGDLLLFHSRLRHRSTDNNSEGSRAAMVYHFAVTDTDGYVAPNHDWFGVIRAGQPVATTT
ncbi:MAG: phytanoyl-CoA dioxygenase family protein, partial [Acidimicrobiales bacterium]